MLPAGLLDDPRPWLALSVHFFVVSVACVFLRFTASPQRVVPLHRFLAWMRSPLTQVAGYCLALAVFFWVQPSPWWTAAALSVATGWSERKKQPSRCCERLLLPKEFIFHNVISAPSTFFERRVLDGRWHEYRDKLALFVTDEELRSNPAANDTVINWLKQFEDAPGLYLCDTDNQVLELIDSLRLYPYIITPAHTQAIQTFSTLLRERAGPSAGTLAATTVATAPKSSPQAASSSRLTKPVAPPPAPSTPLFPTDQPPSPEEVKAKTFL